jgi:hypothetical protein
MYSWWMRMPFTQVTKALTDYAAFLRDKVANPDMPVTPATVAPIQPAPAPTFASVPDLAEIVNLPQDEMRDIVVRFNREGGRGGGRGNRGGGAGAPVGGAPPAPPAPRDNNAWLEAVKSLACDALSHTAKVDYLSITWRAENDLQHQTKTLPPGPACRSDAS